MMRHPGRHELMAHAEALVYRRGTISAKLASHLAQCPICTAEVAAMRRSLEFVQSAPELEPSGNFTAQVLLAARNERSAPPVRGKGAWAVARTVLQTTAYAAGLIVACTVCFGAALRPGGSDAARVAAVAGPAREAESVSSPEALRQAVEEVKTLAAAVSVPSTRPPSQWELEHRRAVTALNADIEAARAALERNPGCKRASHVVAISLQRQAQTLRALYASRSL